MQEAQDFVTSFLSESVAATQEPATDLATATQEPAIDPPNLDTQDDVQHVAIPQ